MSDPTVTAALRTARERLLAELCPDGFWEGYLSSSALATATAVSALSIAGQPEDAPLIQRGCQWLQRTQNPDGGWGDTPDSPSNLSTTLLCLCALTLSRAADHTPGAAARAYLAARAGPSPENYVAAIKALYGADRTFAVPILVNCALAGLASWHEIPELPFELAALPRSLHGALRLQVVSYALPALVAVGALLHTKSPAPSPFRRALRQCLRHRALRLVGEMQPTHGGFLEATPLTAFVTMSLVPVLGPDYPIVRRGLRFLRSSVRPDGSWPIDTNLSVWVTSNAVIALAQSGGIPDEVAARVRPWLLARQYHQRHPFTHAAPGGWPWTHLEGGVPDADDTSGALRALLALGQAHPAPLRAGMRWLLGLRNSDGGWPTFCRGWGRLPFDRSCPDITAHALLALGALPAALRVGLAPVHRAALRYLHRQQRPDGSWVPLWFGNQFAPGHENPVFGTARVLQALAQLEPEGDSARRGLRYLISAQHECGGWGGAPGVDPTVEETARAVVALAAWPGDEPARAALRRGVHWLADRVAEGVWDRPAPIGLYFASLWYSEALYPLAWTVEALGAALQLNQQRAGNVIT